MTRRTEEANPSPDPVPLGGGVRAEHPRPDALVLGIETSCDETAAAVVRGSSEVLSSVVASQNDLHAEYGGVVPELASRAHVEKILPVVRTALREARITLDDVGAVAVGHRPGLIGSLVVGVSAAKALAWSLGVPLIGVDHVHAHLFAGVLSSVSPSPSSSSSSSSSRGTGMLPVSISSPTPSPTLGVAGFQPAPTPSPSPSLFFPSLGLVVSGGHTALYLVESWTQLTRLGATIDDAMGEAFDKAAAILGIPFPGGPNLDRLASHPGAHDRAHDFPISRLGPGSLDFSFSGLKTAVLYAARGVPGPGGVFERDHTALSEAQQRDLAASFQRAAVGAVMLKLGRALDALRERGVPVRTLLTGGGVTANSRLRAELSSFAASRGLDLKLPAMEFCVDNAAMIAGLGAALLSAGQVSDLSLQATPTTAC